MCSFKSVLKCVKMFVWKPFSDWVWRMKVLFSGENTSEVACSCTIPPSLLFHCFSLLTFTPQKPNKPLQVKQKHRVHLQLTCIPGTSMVTSTFSLLQVPVFFFCDSGFLLLLLSPLRACSLKNPFRRKKTGSTSKWGDISDWKTGLFATEWGGKCIKSNCDRKSLQE